MYRVSTREGVVAAGSYLEIVPNERVVFTWGWEGSASVPPGTTRVEVTLTGDGQGTLLRLRHFDLPEQERGMHSQGWQHYMARLQVAAVGGDPGADPWAVAPQDDAQV